MSNKNFNCLKIKAVNFHNVSKSLNSWKNTLKWKLILNSSQSIKYLSWYMLLDSHTIVKKKKWIRQKWFTLYSHPKFVHSQSLGDNNRNEFKKKRKHSLFLSSPNDTERTHLKTGKTNLHTMALLSDVFQLREPKLKRNFPSRPAADAPAVGCAKLPEDFC